MTDTGNRAHGFWRGAIGFRDGISFLAASEQAAPLKLAKPFAHADGSLGICLMDASPGLFNGDSQDISCTVRPGARIAVRTQSACQLHPSIHADDSRQRIRFHVAQNARLEYWPEPIIPFAGASFTGDTEVHLESGAQAVIGEILTPGRAARGELFAYRKVELRLSVYWNGTLTALDPLVWRPAVHEDQAGRRMPELFLGSYTHVGTLWFLSERIAPAHVSALQQAVAAWDRTELYGGCSLQDEGGLAVRIVGRRADDIARAMRELWGLLSVRPSAALAPDS